MSSLFKGGKGRLIAETAKRRDDLETPPLMPDEETLRRTRRRQFARKTRTGRASTILSNPDQLG